MSTTLYERISSLLAAVAWLLASVVGWLAMLWWLRGEPTVPADRPLPAVHNMGVTRSEVEREFLSVPAVETVAMRSASVQDWVELAARGAVQVAAETDFEADSDTESVGGTRDGRRAGPDGDGPPGDERRVPSAERWEIVFTAASRQAYAVQLDQLGIELGAVGKLPGVDYVRRLAGEPIVRHGAGEDEHRLYFSWTSPSPLVKWEQELLARSGIEHQGRLILRFIPPELEAELARLEIEYATRQGYTLVEDIANTVFVTEVAGGTPRFVVAQQRYRRN